MRAFSTKGIAVRSFFGLTAKTLANPGGASATVPPPTPKTWTVRNTGFTASGNTFNQIFWGNGTWVITCSAVFLRITVVTSTDGHSWAQNTVVTSATATETPAAAFGAGVWIVTGNQNGVAPRLSTSPNLSTWTSRTLGFAIGVRVRAPVFGNGIFVLVSSTGPGGTTPYATSPDGINWTQQSTYVPKKWGQPVFDGARFVAPVLNPSNVPKLATSLDGITWTESAVTLSLASPVFMGNNGTSQYVVGDSLSNAGQSINGALTSASTVNFNMVEPTAWLAFGAASDWARANNTNATVGSSNDGLTWVIDTVPATAGSIANMAWNGTEWIAVGGDNASANFAMARGA